MLKKIVSIVCVFSLLLLNMSFAFASPEINEEGVTYIKSQTQSPWATMALVVAGETGLSG